MDPVINGSGSHHLAPGLSPGMILEDTLIALAALLILVALAMYFWLKARTRRADTQKMLGEMLGESEMGALPDSELQEVHDSCRSARAISTNEEEESARAQSMRAASVRTASLSGAAAVASVREPSPRESSADASSADAGADNLSPEPLPMVPLYTDVPIERPHTGLRAAAHAVIALFRMKPKKPQPQQVAPSPRPSAPTRTLWTASRIKSCSVG